jgi:hypothetical protein
MEEKPLQNLAVDKPSFEVKNTEGEVVFEGSLKEWYARAKRRQLKAEREKKRYLAKSKVTVKNRLPGQVRGQPLLPT